MRSRLELMKKVALSLRGYQRWILNGFEAKKQYKARIVEGLNALVKLRFRKTFGFRTFDAMKVALYYQLGDLPDLSIARRFF